MPTLDEIVNDESKEMEMIEPVYEEVQQPSQSSELLKRILTSDTGEGNISDYIDHPMNFNKSMGLAQILRGITGIVGNLKLAIIDIGFGVLRFSKEKRGGINDISDRGDFPS